MIKDRLKSVWPEWQLEEEPIGRGSYGAVYKAVKSDLSGESVAAVKVVSVPRSESELDSLYFEGMSDDEISEYLAGAVREYVDEIKVMELFKGTQNIVSIEDSAVLKKEDSMGYDIFIRMELLASFSEHIRKTALTEPEAIKLGADICSALELLGMKNIIHCDIKPQNIFISKFGDFKLGDFGVARALEANPTVKGTRGYMAPEVERKEPYDARADIYSLGMVLYSVMNRGPAPKDRTGGKLPPPCMASQGLSDIILRACSPDPDDRFPTAAEFKRALLSLDTSSEAFYRTEAPASPVKKRKDAAVAGKAPVRKRTPVWARLLIGFGILIGAAILAAAVFLVGVILGFTGEFEPFSCSGSSSGVGDINAFLKTICTKYTISDFESGLDVDVTFEMIDNGLVHGTIKESDGNSGFVFRMNDIRKEGSNAWSFKIANLICDSSDEELLNSLGVKNGSVFFIYPSDTYYHDLPDGLASALSRNVSFSGNYVLKVWVLWSEEAGFYIWGYPPTKTTYTEWGLAA